MQPRRILLAFVALIGLLGTGPALGVAAAPADYQPDPKAVQHYGPAYRYPQAGWTVLHIEGAPYERGYQHGRLMAPEIAALVRCSAALCSSTAPPEGWKNARLLINALFVRRYAQEYLEEMRGIADGAADAGARFEGRPIDLVDVVGLNVWPEIETLESALEATPTGLEGIRFSRPQLRATPLPKPMHCSAFAATGPATADGKIVFGHITMFGLYPANFYNVWLDVKPAQGHRVLMQSYPGGIQSGLDYYMNDAGLLIAETTITQTHFDARGLSVASRIRQALQYADSIDKAVASLRDSNNGLYTNEWLLADTKTNEIAMFELGTARSRLYRSSKNEWFGGTEGFYWGCNNTKDLAVRLETIPGVKGRPANLCFCPADRDLKWVELYRQYKGKIDADFGKLAFTTPPLAAYHSLDAKFTTSELARQLKTWALFGPPLGRTWEPTLEEQKRFPEIRPLVSNPWTILHAAPPAGLGGPGLPVVDLPEPMDTPVREALAKQEDQPLPTRPAWHGTLLPRTGADTWLAAAFAEYERLAALKDALAERDRGESQQGDDLPRKDRDQLAVLLYGFRSLYLAGARASGDVPLARTRSDVTQNDWYRVAVGKGVLLLHTLAQLRTDFANLMDSFGRAHAGKEVTAGEFQAHAEQAARDGRLHEFFAFWLQQPGLPPSPRLGTVTTAADGKGYQVACELFCPDRPAPTPVEVTVETARGETSQRFVLGPGRSLVTVQTKAQPQAVVVDKYDATKTQGGAFTVLSFYAEPEQALIIYGTADEVPSNREAAEALQRAIIERHANYAVPIKTDREVTEDDLKRHHLLLIGRPDSNTLVQRFRGALPVTFGSRSFRVRRDSYAHPGSAVVAAADNPLNPRYSLVVLAGLGAASTRQAPPLWLGRVQQPAGEVLVLPNKDKPRALMVPAKALVRELKNGGEYLGKKD